MPIKSNLSRILGEHRMKMSDLAKRAGVAQNTVLALYHERLRGSLLRLDKLCKALDCQPGVIFMRIGEEK